MFCHTFRASVPFDSTLEDWLHRMYNILSVVIWMRAHLLLTLIHPFVVLYIQSLHLMHPFMSIWFSPLFAIDPVAVCFKYVWMDRIAWRQFYLTIVYRWRDKYHRESLAFWHRTEFFPFQGLLLHSLLSQLCVFCGLSFNCHSKELKSIWNPSRLFHISRA